MPSDSTGPQSGYPAPEPIEFGPPLRERADAARNRQRILAAAERLFAEHGVARVSVDAVASAAGVGKGTVFRRFGDKAGLAVALLDETERRLQEKVLSGVPPLGPGAPPRERALAFLAAYAHLVENSTDLLMLSETASPGARYRIGAYRFWHRHLVYLIEECGAGVDAPPAAHALLAPLAADLYAAQRDAGISPARIAANVVQMAGVLLPPPTQPRRRKRQRSPRAGSGRDPD